MLCDESTKEIHTVYARHLAIPDGPIEKAVCVRCLLLLLFASTPPVWLSLFFSRLGMKSRIAWGAMKGRLGVGGREEDEILGQST